ncbi:MAG: hypothetical protein AAF460_13750 [Pseudomonadota bacterium]
MDTGRQHRSETTQTHGQRVQLTAHLGGEVPESEALVSVEATEVAVPSGGQSPGIGFSMLVVLIVAALAAVAIMRRPVRAAEADRPK